MDKNINKKLIEEMGKNSELIHEKRFSAEDFTKEIALLISYHFNEYFNGEYKFDGEGIICEFENGQKFTIVAKEIL